MKLGVLNIMLKKIIKWMKDNKLDAVDIIPNIKFGKIWNYLQKLTSEEIENIKIKQETEKFNF